MRTCQKNGRENAKNAKMNSSTQKCITYIENCLENYLRKIDTKIDEFLGILR